MKETKRHTLNVICLLDIILGVVLMFKGEIPAGLLVIMIGGSLMNPKEEKEGKQ